MEMVTQGLHGQIITVKKGEVPVINSDVKNLEIFVPMIINFLRSGCPKVQIYSPWGGTETVNLIKLLQRFETEKEKFSLSYEIKHIYEIYLSKK